MKRKNTVIARSHVHGAVLGTLDERRFFVRPDAAAAAARFVEQNSRDGGDGGERDHGRADASHGRFHHRRGGGAEERGGGGEGGDEDGV